MKPFWVYMLRCSDGLYYTGHTDDLDRRFAEHQSGELHGFTSTRRPVELVYASEMPTRDEAINREMQLKNWSQAKKEALIRSDWVRVARLAWGTDRWPSFPRK
jgi:predicted GIY-YIG superfamily endonuclease